MGTFRPDAPELVDSTRAIKAIGTNGIPTLLKLLQAHDIKGSQQLESFVRRLGWKTFEITHAKEKWNLADRGFILLGNDAKSAAPILVNILKASPPETAPYILSSLVEIQSPREIALPVLIEQLSNTNRDIRWYGAYFLHKLYPEEAEKAGVYNLFPKFRPHSTNAPAVNK